MTKTIKHISHEHKIWVTWERQRRNSSMAKALDSRYFEFHSPRNRVQRYLELSLKTVRLLRKERPRVLFVQNPSIVLSLIGIFYRKLTKNTVVIDAHNAGIFPCEGECPLLNIMARFIFRNADYTIVTNESLARYVKHHNGKAVVAPDPLPDIPPQNQPKENDSREFMVLCICTWSPDEPYIEILKAAQILLQTEQRVKIYFSGNSRGKESELGKALPKNVELLGFIDDSKYISMLQQSRLTIDLTDREHCLVCGAYESVSAETPMLLSNTQALQDYFDEGALFCNNTAHDIANQIKLAIKNEGELQTGIVKLKKRLHRKYKIYVEAINNLPTNQLR